jgi:hypothetical protein
MTYLARRSNSYNTAHPGRCSRWREGGAGKGRYHVASGSLPAGTRAPTNHTPWAADVEVASEHSAETVPG